MPAARDEIEAALKKKGFVLNDGDHRYFRLHVDGRATAIFTKTSHGNKYKTLGDALVAAMAKQLKLTKKQFGDLVDCRMSGDAYLQALHDQSIVP